MYNNDEALSMQGFPSPPQGRGKTK